MVIKMTTQVNEEDILNSGLSLCSNNIDFCKKYMRKMKGLNILDLICPQQDEKEVTPNTKHARRFIANSNLAKKNRDDPDWWNQFDIVIYTPNASKYIKKKVDRLVVYLSPDLSNYSIKKNHLTVMEQKETLIHFTGEIGKTKCLTVESMMRNPKKFMSELGIDSSTIKRMPPMLLKAFFSNEAERTKRAHFFKYFVLKEF